MIKDAIFSPCGQYRYSLSRAWDESKPYAPFIGLNPSYVDAENGDRTLSRCISFAKNWGYGGVYMANLFALVHTRRHKMMKAPDPIGIDNDSHLIRLIASADLAMVAWGSEGRHLKCSAVTRQLLPETIMCFVLDVTGEPKHPLYMRNDSVLTPLS